MFKSLFHFQNRNMDPPSTICFAIHGLVYCWIQLSFPKLYWSRIISSSFLVVIEYICEVGRGKPCICVKIAMSDWASGILCGLHSNFLLKDLNKPNKHLKKLYNCCASSLGWSFFFSHWDVVRSVMRWCILYTPHSTLATSTTAVSSSLLFIGDMYHDYLVLAYKIPSLDLFYAVMHTVRRMLPWHACNQYGL